MKIAVIGGGWYGCHIATTLVALGFEVTVMESSNLLLNAASGNNQFRLHLGFHYARHHGTRVQSRDGFMRFMERYRPLTREVSRNYYAVASEDSLIDFPTYKLIMTASGLNFREIECPSELSNVDGVIAIDERVLLLTKVRQYFSELLGTRLQLQREAKRIRVDADAVFVDNERFDYAIDCTWGHLSPPDMAVFYEPTLLLYYESDRDFPAITLVDGQLGSVYPTEDPHVYTLSSVPHTPLGRFGCATDARACLNGVGTDVVDSKRKLMEEQITRYIRSFQDHFRFLGPQLSIKTKPIGKVDDRSCYVAQNGRLVSVMSGKIDTVFHAMERILTIIEQGQFMSKESERSTLKSDIANQSLRRSPHE